MTIRAGRLEPLATASSEPHRSASSRFRPRLRFPARIPSRLRRRGCGECFGIDLVGRLVDQSPGEVDAFAQDAAAGDRRFAAASPEQRLERVAVFFGPVQILARAADDRSADAAFGPCRGPAVVEKEGDVGAVWRPGCGRRPPTLRKAPPASNLAFVPARRRSTCFARPTVTKSGAVS